jgi:hypothetical protein
MKNEIVKVIAEYLEKETVHAGTHNGEFVKFGGVINNGHFTHSGFCQEIAAEIAEKLEGALNHTMKQYTFTIDELESIVFALTGEDVKKRDIQQWLNENKVSEVVGEKDYPYTELFDHMSNEHGLTLTNTELGDIIHIARGK